MCGIAGIFSLTHGSPELAAMAQRMNDAIRHRGPDGEGYLLIAPATETPAFASETPQQIIHSNILHKPLEKISLKENLNGVFAHRRLSIIDISESGHQPLCNRDKTLWITYNGEIYNYIELRDELGNKGYTFHTATDTEVVLAAYTEWGYECVNRFNGMWAFVIYDKHKKQLFASRDRFGVKPFYYAKNERLFAFASEQKALLKGGVVPFKPNEKAIFDYWFFGEMETEEEGMFSGIKELFPAHSLTLNLQSSELKTWKYYTLPYSPNYFETAPQFDKEQVLDKVLSLTLQAVWLRLRADTEVGCCLSGGLDSSTIVSSIFETRKTVYENALNDPYIDASLRGLPGNTVNTFTAAFRNQAIDESKWAGIVSDYTQSRAHYTYPSSHELLQDLTDLIYCQDIPIWSTSTYAQFRVMKLAKENAIKVLLDGQGGDELFAGYDHYYFYHFRDRALKGGSLRSEAAQTGRQKELINRYYKTLFLKKYMFDLPAFAQLKVRMRAYPELNYLNKDFIRRNKTRLYRPKDSDSLNGALYKDFTGPLLKGYLKCEDRCSMWHSVESRTPFADDINLIEYVFSLPSAMKIQDGILKPLLRNAMKGIVPAPILDRKDKMGYVTPNRQWIADIRNDVKDVFEHSAVQQFLDTQKILKNYDTLFNQPNAPDDGRIFKLMAFAKWMEIFNK